MGKLERGDLVYPELCYEIIGCAFEVFNELGPGHSEKVYQQAMAISLKAKQFCFTEQLPCKLLFHGKSIGKGFLDFLVEEKIVVELKKDIPFTRANIDQVFHYLKATERKLAILINFTKNGVSFKRVVNVNELS